MIISEKQKVSNYIRYFIFIRTKNNLNILSEHTFLHILNIQLYFRILFEIM